MRERWFEETYVNGTPYRSLSRGGIDEELVDLIAQVLTAVPPRSVLLADHLETCARSIGALWRRVAAIGADRLRVDALRAKVDHLLAEVRERGPQSIRLALSHGDLSAKNLLRQDCRLVCIDWELADHRSALHDLQYFCYWPLVWPGARPLDRQQLEARTAILSESTAILHEHLTRHHSPLASRLGPDWCDPWVSRRLLLLEVMALEGAKPQTNDRWARRLLDYLERWTAIVAAIDARSS